VDGDGTEVVLVGGVELSSWRGGWLETWSVPRDDDLAADFDSDVPADDDSDAPVSAASLSVAVAVFDAPGADRDDAAAAASPYSSNQ